MVAYANHNFNNIYAKCTQHAAKFILSTQNRMLLNEIALDEPQQFCT